MNTPLVQQKILSHNLLCLAIEIFLSSKTDKPLSPKEAETLIELCSKNESSYLIYQFFGEDKKALSLVKLFEKSPHALFVRFFKAEPEALNMLASMPYVMAYRSIVLYCNIFI